MYYMVAHAIHCIRASGPRGAPAHPDARPRRPRAPNRLLFGRLALLAASPAMAAVQSDDPRTTETRPIDARPSDPPAAVAGSEHASPPGLWHWPPAPLTEPLVTDRPDFTESTDAVPRGRFQLEGGYTFTYDHERKERLRSHTAPELLLRLGLFDDFELRIGWEGYAWESALFEAETRAGRRVLREDWSQGGNDLSLGFKHKLWEQDGLRPHFGVIGELTVPSGSAGVSSADVDPEVKLLWSYDLNERLALSGNVNFAVPSEDAGRFFQTAASVSAAYSLTDRIGTYVEYFGFYPNARGSNCAHTLNGGLTFLITDNFQLDCRVGTGLNDEADDFFAGVGFAIRW